MTEEHPQRDRREVRGRAAALRIRKGMDVFSAYNNQYIGTVMRVWPEGPRKVRCQVPHDERRPSTAAERGATAAQQGATPAAAQAPPLVHEEGAQVSPTENVGRKELGESMGPFPTGPVGNTGPVLQSAEHEYATQPRAPGGDVVLFAVRPGRINPLARPLYIPSSAVHSVSMERIILNVQKEGIPAEWRARPG